MSKACYKCMRVLVIIFNFLFVLMGVAIVACGIFMLVDESAKSIVIPSGHGPYVNYGLYALMATGGVTLLIGLFGCCGAFHESQCLLACYFIFLLLIFAVQVAAGVMGFIFKQQIFGAIDKTLESLVANRTKVDTPTAIDDIQILLQCCGNKGPTDYNPLKIPVSCCDKRKSKCEKSSLMGILTAYKTGCGDAYRQFASRYFMIILCVVLGIAATEFLGLIFAISLCCNVRYRERAYQTVETHDGHHYT